LVDDDAPIASDEPDRVAVPMPADPAAAEPVVPFVAAPVAAVLAPADVGEVGTDAAGVPAAVDVVVLLPRAAAVVVLLDVPVIVVPCTFPCMLPCTFVDVVVWAWSAVASSRTSATVTVTTLDGRDVARAPRRTP
jgi:hypothetical protein